MASGQVSANNWKFYFYAKQNDNPSHILLAEVIISDDSTLSRVQLSIKTKAPKEEAEDFANDLLNWM
jgi:hypothetical protein